MKRILVILLLCFAGSIRAQEKLSHPLGIDLLTFEIDTPGIVYKPLHWRFSAANGGSEHGWRVCWRMEIDTAAKISFTMTDLSGTLIDTLPLEPHTTATSYFTLKTEHRPLSTGKNFYGVIRSYLIRKGVKDSSDYVSIDSSMLYINLPALELNTVSASPHSELKSSLFPNPLINNTTLLIESEKVLGATISIYELSGKVFKRNEVTLKEGKNTFAYPKESLPNAGSFRIEPIEGKPQTIKFINE